MARLAGTRRGIVGLLLGVTAAIAGSREARAAPAQEGPQEGSASDLSPEDRLAILELIALYAWAYDCDDAEALGKTFTADGVLEVFGQVLGTGADGFGDMIAHAREMKARHGWQHLTGHHVFRDCTAGSCKVYSYYTMAESDAQGGNVTMRAMGYYASDCVRVSGKWLFARRAVTRWTGKLPFAA